MVNSFRKFSLVLVGTLAVAACDQSSQPVATEFEIAESRVAAPSIVGIASTSPDFQVLTAAVVATGLASVLDGQQHYTVFAPTDAAFFQACGANVVADCVANLVGALGGVDNVRKVLLYHVTRGDRNATSVLAAGKLRMLNGADAPVYVFEGKPYIAGAEIVLPNIRASNGMIHVIDNIMTGGL
jgi:uncharacterized surface protein with fasciclin (FAS1) repeats